MNKLVIAQLSDIHVSEKDKIMNEVNLRDNYLQALNQIKKHYFDILIITGDLALDVDDTPYEWIKRTLQGINYAVLPGNHDNVTNFVKAFSLEDHYKNGSVFYSMKIKEHTLIFCDTSSEYLDLERLQEELDLNDDGSNVLLFMHHPPSLANCKYMDSRYPLSNHLDTTSFLNQNKRINNVFCGHYHTDHSVQKENFSFTITPSTWFQIGKKPSTFNIKHTNPGWTMIEVGGKKVTTKTFFIK
ncbi:MAG: metallophosphoesterase [Candidatus Delongbacteria bacterium]|nr:metallophosphoesterase [Candidatus Delongbacteria bacterium]